MSTLFVEDVFRDTGVPEYTYVIPREHNKLLVALRTKGKGLIVEGPSGIGKTTCIKKILEERNIEATYLSARRKDDVAVINTILNTPQDKGVIIVDDFHVLEDETKQRLADLLKLLADELREDIKLVLVGINKAGDTLIHLAPDLVNRIDCISFGSCTEEQLSDVVSKGETALNIEISIKDQIIEKSRGSFHIAQMLCKEICILAGCIETVNEKMIISNSLQSAIDNIMHALEPAFDETITEFASGNRARKGRYIYLRFLKWLSETNDGILSLNDSARVHANFKPSITSVINNGYLSKLIAKKPRIKDDIYYNEEAHSLSIENPKLFFYLQNLDWNQYCKNKGYSLEDDGSSYDFALSFTGEKREYAETVKQLLIDRGYEVFYDNDHGAEMLAHRMEPILQAVYSHEAKFVVALIDEKYLNKFWTAKEASFYKDRIDNGSVVTVYFSNESNPSPFDPIAGMRYLVIDQSKDFKEECERITAELAEFIAAHG